METPKRYLQVFINGDEKNLPKKTGRYIVHFKGADLYQDIAQYIFECNGMTMTEDYDYWMDNVDWYLLPESDKPEGKTEELSSNDIDIIVGILTQYGHFDMAADLMERYNNLIIKLYKSPSKSERDGLEKNGYDFETGN